MNNRTIIIALVISISTVVLLSVASTEAWALLSLPKHIIAFWPADGNATDVTGHGHNGTLVGGVTFGPARTNQAFFFNGTNGFVKVGSLGIFNTNKPFSIVAWVKPTSSILHDNSSRVILQEGATGSNTPYDKFMVGFALGRATESGVLSLEIGATQTFSQVVYVPTLVPANKWSFVAATYDGSQTAAGMKLYINGIAQSTATLGSGFTGTATSRDQWSIGAEGYAPTPVDSFNGGIDDVKVFSCALNSTQVAAQFHGNNRATC